MRQRSTLLVFVLAALLVAGCSPDESDGTTTAPEVTGEGPGTTATPSTTPPPSTIAPTLPPGTEDLPEAVRQDLADLIGVTEEVRRLEFIEQPAITVVSGEELAQRVRDQLTEDLEDLPADEALYDLLGLIDEELDLQELYSDLYSEQVAGFYDGEAGELVVPAEDDGFTPVQRATLVHELTHALTDQHHDFFARLIETIDADRFDESTAYRSLSEGDATLAQLLYLQRLPIEEQRQFFEESFQVDTEVLDSAPPFIRDALVFPYQEGFTFVDRLYAGGGFDAIGQAYQSPPTSTEQIIDPADFPADAPIDVEAPEVALEGYELAYGSTWGELGFRLMFDQVLGGEVSETASHGWGGDAYQLHFDGTEVVLVLEYVGDSTSDAAEMGDALRSFVTTAMEVEDEAELGGGTAYTGEDNAWVRVDGASAYFVASSAPEPFERAIEPHVGADDGA